MLRLNHLIIRALPSPPPCIIHLMHAVLYYATDHSPPKGNNDEANNTPCSFNNLFIINPLNL